MKPDLTYIVSAFDGPADLRTCLASLACQTHRNFEVIVTDNTEDVRMSKRHSRIVAQIAKDLPAVRYIRTARKIVSSDCYFSGEWAARNVAQGAFLCFPCDDCYYVPRFGQKMLGAAFGNAWDFVECTPLAGPDMTGLEVYGKLTGHVIKSSFIIRAETFKELGYWTGKHPDSFYIGADRQLGHHIAVNKVPAGKVNEELVVHN